MQRSLFIFGIIALFFSLPNSAWADETYRLRVDGLACPFCAYGIEKQLSRIEGVETVETDIESGTVIITMKPGVTLDEAEAKRAVAAAGFTMRDFKRKDKET